MKERKGAWAALLGLVLSAVGLAVAFRGLALADVASALKALRVPPLLLAAIPIAAGATLRTLRWNLLCRSTRFGPSLEAVCVSAFFNGVLPFRTGDVLRPLYFARRTGSPVASAVAAAVAERILDVATLAGIGLFVFSGSETARRVPTAAVAAGALALVALLALGTSRLVRRPPRPDASRVARFVAETLRALSAAGSPARLAAAVALSIAMWLATAGPFVLGLEAAGRPSSLREGLGILLAVTFAIALPSSPGFIGTFHAGFVLGARGFGIADAISLPAALVTHLLLQVPFILAGAAILAAGGRRLVGGRQGEEAGGEAARLS